jgi:acyl-homoserine lactone acylase PvdQ
VLSALEGVTFERFAQLVWDSRLSEADGAIAALRAELARMPAAPARDTLSEVVARLDAWDRALDTASVEATWLVLAAERFILSRRAGTRSASPWLDALADALRRLRAEWGSSEVPWGRLSRHQRPLPGAAPVLDPSRPSLAVGGGPGGLGSVFTFETAPFGSAGPRLGRGGNSFVKVIAFGDVTRAGSILNYGQSGAPDSPHFFDQAQLYARREFKPAWLTRADVEANAVRSYNVAPR